MKHSGRYAVSGLIEGQFEPGSQGRVLRNLIGVKRKREMDRAEGKELVETFKRLIGVYDENHRFSTADLCSIHKEWLGSIYDWGGKYRQVNLAKGDFTFAAAHLIPGLMEDFRDDYLSVYTPCRIAARNEIIHAIATVHVELLLIHPFREGNGRLARLLSTLMALQAGLPLLDFSGLDEEHQQQYFAAVQYGMGRNYEPMAKVFTDVVARSFRTHGE